MVCPRRSDQGKDTVNERCQKSSYAKLLRSLIGISPHYQLHMNRVKIFADASVFDAGRISRLPLPMKNPHRIWSASCGGILRREVLRILFYMAPIHFIDPTMIVAITRLNSIASVIHFNQCIMLLASYRSVPPGADICPAPSSRDPLS